MEMNPEIATPARAALSLPVPQVEEQQYLSFMLEGEMFASGILSIKEIIGYGDVTPVPTMPPAVRGVINLRGAVVPVLDLALRLGKASPPVTRCTSIVIVEVRDATGRRDVGVIVDAVNTVLDIPRSQIEPAPTFGASISRAFIHGMAKLGGNLVILLDFDAVLALGDQA